jgi:hypothetical protein
MRAKGILSSGAKLPSCPSTARWEHGFHAPSRTHVTRKKNLKKKIRARMEKTGESYTAAQAQVRKTKADDPLRTALDRLHTNRGHDATAAAATMGYRCQVAVSETIWDWRKDPVSRTAMLAELCERFLEIVRAPASLTTHVLFRQAIAGKLEPVMAANKELDLSGVRGLILERQEAAAELTRELKSGGAMTVSRDGRLTMFGFRHNQSESGSLRIVASLTDMKIPANTLKKPRAEPHNLVEIRFSSLEEILQSPPRYGDDLWGAMWRFFGTLGRQRR